ncbi:phosphatidylglycerol lysyltransferase domain-containing protein [Chitinophagaceae bacterium LB-8]|uniref:Phosphatidylglycerol lysyltransferase n=1 Tax=Paraflavisolibacter caeni TaxID=2982496 RepID=A0A9X3BGG7_9BACT|nr:phosphatidylglycerol lysyltransferase domain-containing protein [Paraflavisolibacter caeni]MCU7547718.1 phosphatidylglycerol lysyltransferase domain-containing protein [Paraflavisolibacter caeni]
MTTLFLKNGTLSRFARMVGGYSKTYWREAIALLVLLISIYFLRKERHEMATLLPHLQKADPNWLLIAAAVTILFIVLQSGIYINSFRAIKSSISWKHAIELFLKRNLLAVFLPGGGVSALAYVPFNIKKAVGTKSTIHQASGIFAFAGMLSTLIVGLPVLFLNIGDFKSQAITGLAITTLLTLLVILLFTNLKNKGWWHQFLQQRFPGPYSHVNGIIDAGVDHKQFALAITNSVGVELCGIIHLYIAMLAIGAPASLQAAGIAYIVATLLMVASPFLKGLGAVELSIAYILSRFGYVPVQALSIVIIYRVFEFWLPLVGGLFVFLLKGRSIFFRIFPAVSIFLLGLINIISVITPPVAQRIHRVRLLMPGEAIQATNLLVLFAGFVLIITAAFLVKGQRNAWRLALVISFISLTGHLIKAFDYEEALIAGTVFVILLFTQKHYRVKSNPKLIRMGIQMAVISLAVVLVYGFIGFYFLEKRHFGVDFTWQQSLINSIRGFLMLQPEGLQPLTKFGREFLGSFHVLGLGAWLFLFYALIKPYLRMTQPQLTAREKAEQLVQLYGHSALDYFKLTNEKLIYISKHYDGFISYAMSGGFAVVLEEPVCSEANKVPLLKEFEEHCRKTGLKIAFYRVDESSLNYFSKLKMKKLLIGQEALLDVTAFDLGGKSKKALRNGLNSLEKKGYYAKVCTPPHSPEFLAQLKNVSDEWLHTYHQTELAFAQGTFDETIIKMQDIVALFHDGSVVAFLNIIPDYAPNECTYDLIRKVADAPGGCIDGLIVQLIEYAQQKGLRNLNMGLAPLSGIKEPENAAEQVMKYAYDRFKRFKQYQGAREFKEKYASAWLNKYLVYENDFDLLLLPATLNRVMKPSKLNKS